MAAEEATGGRMSLLEHLTELRRRLLHSILAVVAGAVACWFLYPWILDLLLEPYCEIQGDSAAGDVFGEGCELLVTDPLEPFSVRLTVAGYGGLALAMPFLLWHVWRFVSPGLYRRERRWAIPFVACGVLLFAAGVTRHRRHRGPRGPPHTERRSVHAADPVGTDAALLRTGDPGRQAPGASPEPHLT